MDKVLFFKGLIEKVTDNQFLKKLYSWLAMGVAFIAIIYGIVEFINRCSYVGEGIEAILSWIIYQVLWLVLIYLAFHFWWMRGTKIASMKDNDYILWPAAAHYSRAIGETIASFSVLMSLALTFHILLTNKAQSSGSYYSQMLKVGEIPWLLPAFSTESAFLWSLAVLLNGIIAGVVLLGVFYLLAESFEITLDICRNIRKR